MSQNSGTVSVISLPGVPGKPQHATAVAVATSADITWQAPVSPGGEPITGYRVTALPGFAHCTTSLTTCRIEGLAPGWTYKFAVVDRKVISVGRPSLTNYVKIFSADK